MWSKVTKNAPSKVKGPGVKRYNQHAKVFMPKHMAHADRVDFYYDGSGRFAYQFREKGEYKVRVSGAQAEFTLPAKLQPMIPHGIHHNLDIKIDGGLIDGLHIIDTRQFEAEDNRRVPAE